MRILTVNIPLYHIKTMQKWENEGLFSSITEIIRLAIRAGIDDIINNVEKEEERKFYVSTDNEVYVPLGNGEYKKYRVIKR